MWCHRLCRENSARKEALPILQQYLSNTALDDGSGSAAAPAPASEATPAAPASPEEQQGPAAGAAGEAAHSLAAIKVGARGVVAFRLVQPGTAGNGSGSDPAGCGAGGPAAAAAAPASASADACSGSPEAISHSAADAAGAAHVQRTVAALLADIAAGSQPRLAHVQRVIPVQTTCRMERAALAAAGARLAALVAAALPGCNATEASDTGNAAEGADTGTAADPLPEPTSRAAHKVTFGISLKQRALDGAGGKPAEPTAAAPPAAGDEAAGGQPGEADVATVAPAAAPDSGEGVAPLDRGAIISALAGGFEAALRQAHGCEAAVDLKQPGWVLVVEALPAAGSLYAALSALPADLCVFKPKLHIKPVGKA